MKVKSLSRVRLFSTPWTAAHQAPVWEEGFSWSRLPLPSPVPRSNTVLTLHQPCGFSHFTREKSVCILLCVLGSPDHQVFYRDTRSSTGHLGGTLVSQPPTHPCLQKSRTEPQSHSIKSIQIRSDQSLSRVRLFATP